MTIQLKADASLSLRARSVLSQFFFLYLRASKIARVSLIRFGAILSPEEDVACGTGGLSKQILIRRQLFTKAYPLIKMGSICAAITDLLYLRYSHSTLRFSGSTTQLRINLNPVLELGYTTNARFKSRILNCEK